MVRDDEPARVLVPPAEPRDTVVIPVEDARLARRRLCRQQRLPAIEGHGARAEPPREVGRASRPKVFFEHRMRESIDLDEHDARLVGDAALAAPCLELADEGAEERMIVAGPQHGVHQRVDRRKDHRADERVDRSVIRDPSDL